VSGDDCDCIADTEWASGRMGENQARHARQLEVRATCLQCILALMQIILICHNNTALGAKELFFSSQVVLNREFHNNSEDAVCNGRCQSGLLSSLQGILKCD